MQPPSVWSTAFDPVEEVAMILLQQAVLKMLAVASHRRTHVSAHAIATCAGAGRRVGQRRPEVLASRNSSRGKVRQQVSGKGLKVAHSARI